MKNFKIPDDPLLLPVSITSRLYPRPHLDIVKESAKEFSVDEDIVYAIMRQESFLERMQFPLRTRGVNAGYARHRKDHCKEIKDSKLFFA